MFTEKEARAARDNGWVIVSGASDDLMEFEGILQDEGDCFDDGKVYFSKPGVYSKEGDKADFQDCIGMLQCNKASKDEDGGVTPQTYEADILRETSMVYEGKEPCYLGVMFPISSLK